MIDKIAIIHRKDNSYAVAPESAEKLKALYNHMLSRISKAEIYFDNTAASEEEKELFIPEFEKLLKQISAVMNLMDTLKVFFKKEIKKG